MPDIKRVIDGDTIATEDDKIRVGYINTPESVHVDEDRNTSEGDIASEFAKDVLPKGKPVIEYNYGKDHFGRKVSSVKRDINGVEIDYGLVALDQQMSTYYTEFGTHPDPLSHDQYKEYYSKDVPYQFGSTEEPLTQDEMVSMTAKQKKFTETYQAFKEGDVSQEDFDNVTADLYGNPDLVMRYRHQVSNWNKPTNQTSPHSIEGAMKRAFEQDPSLKDTYNRAVRNGHLMSAPTPEDEPSFWEKTKNSFSLLNFTSNAVDTDALYDSRRLGKNFDVPINELTKGVPEQFHSLVLQEAAKYNDQSGLLMRDQLIEDIQNNKVFDDMEWYAQLGYGALAIITDPTALVGAGVVAKGGQAINNSIRAWTTNRTVRNTALISEWAAGGALEGSLVNAPRLSGDHTYTAKDYQLDILFDAGFGVLLGGGITGGIKGYEFMNEIRDSRMKEQQEIQNYVEKGEVPTVVDDKVVQATIPEQASKKVAQVTNTKFEPWEAITQVSTGGYKTAVKTLNTVFPQNTPMRKLMNSQLGLLKKSVDGADEIVTKLNADILHIASAFPEGKVPKAIEQEIESITFTQKTTSRKHALQDVLQGTTTEATETLGKYIQALRNQKELWEGYDPIPMARGDFFAHQSDWLSVEGRASKDDLFNLVKELPKELSYIKDVIELNRMAAKKDDVQFTNLVEELNGLVTTRLDQREFGDFRRYSDSSKSWGKTVRMTPPEIAAQLKKEGLQPRTTEYSKRLNELKQRGRTSVGKDVNQLGRIDEFEVGKLRESNVEGEVYHTLDDANTRLHELQKKPEPTREDVSEAKSLEDFTAKSKNDKETTLVADTFEQDLLPRSYTVTESVEAYKNPTKESLENLRSQLNTRVIKKLGLKQITGKAERKGQQERLEKVKSAMVRDKDTVIKRMVQSGKWQSLEDVIRVSNTLAEEAKLKPKVEGEINTLVKPLTEEDIETVGRILQNDSTAPKLTPEDFNVLKTNVNNAYDKLVEEATNATAEELAKFVRTGEKRAFELLRKPKGVLDYVGRFASKITEDLGSKFQNGKLTSLEYIGSRITEIGRGYGGVGRRKATGGIIKDATYKESVMQILPQYASTLDKYAANKGKNAWGRLQAQQQAGADSKLVDQFNREVFTVQELRRQGKDLPEGLDQTVLDFVAQWDKYMDYNHGKLVESNIGGFTKERKIKHYIPHVWKSGNLEASINKHGLEKVTELFRRAYASAAENGTNPIKAGEAQELAVRQIEWIKKQGDEPSDQFLPVADSRAKQRLDLDTTMEFEGLNIIDLLDNDIASIATKYSQRMSGWTALSKSTDGLLTSQLHIDTLKQNMIQEGKAKGIDTGKYEKYYDDLMDLMFGRPTRGGLTQELRQLKDLTALTRMGGLGTAQLIETGQVITRSVINTFSQPSVAKKHIKAGLTDGTDERTLLREIQSLTNLTDDIEWLDRQSVHLDQAELAKLSKARQLSLWVADKATFGSLKAPASRLLGKTSAYNAIRRAQSRVAQMSFALDVTKHFKDGSGKMGNARLADLGLTDKDGIDIDLKEAINTHVEFGEDGLPTKMNFDKWSVEAREKFQYGAIRDEAQQIQRTQVGELPPYMNRPLMSLILQFRQMPLVATNKQLGRSLAFADKEAVANVMLNTALAGLVRYSKFALLGLGVHAITGQEAQDPTTGQMQMDKYITQLGIFADSYDLVLQANQIESSGDAADTALRQLPVLGLMNDYRKLGTSDSVREQIESAQGLTPLGNTAYGEMIHTWIQEVNSEE